MHGNGLLVNWIFEYVFVKWKDAITETENAKLSRQIIILQSALRIRFCKSIIKEAKENYYITDNDLVRFIEYFKIGIVIIKDFK